MKNRIQFANLESKQIWEKKLNDAGKFSKKLIRESLLRGIVNSKIVNSKRVDEQSMLILSNNGFFVGYINDELIAISDSEEELLNIQELFNEEKYEELSKIIRWPSCCLRKYIDNTRDKVSGIESMIAKSNKKNHKTFTKDRVIPRELIRLEEALPHLNPFFSSYGIQLLDYIPCTYQCEESLVIATELSEMAKMVSESQYDSLMDILTMPAECSSLKGIAEIKTPVFKFMYKDHYRYPELCIQKEGNNYPREAPNGIYFPWKMKGMGACDTRA